MNVVIGILTFNGYATTRACLETLPRLRGWPVPTVIVDNGSRERDGEQLASEFGAPIRALTLPANLGVPGGYNAAIRWAHDVGASHVLLLNNDTLITDPDLLERLLAATGPQVAAVGPLVLEADGSLFSAGGSIHWPRGRPHHLRKDEMPGIDRPYEVTWIDGPCMFVSVEVACRVGGLHEGFVSYWEEIDWCVRAGRRGYRCLVEPRTSIVHLRGATIPSWQAKLYLLRNRVLFMRRNAGWRYHATFLPYFVLRVVPVFIARHLLSPADLGKAFRTAVSAASWNAADALRRRAWRVAADGPSVCDEAA